MAREKLVRSPQVITQLEHISLQIFVSGGGVGIGVDAGANLVCGRTWGVFSKGGWTLSPNGRVLRSDLDHVPVIASRMQDPR